MKRLLRLENICLAVYSEEEALQGKGKHSFLHLMCWMSGKVLDTSHSLSVLKIHNWKKMEKLRGKLAYFCSLVWGCLTGLLFDFWFWFFFFSSHYKLKFTGR